MKKFYWKKFIKDMGVLKFIFFLITIIYTSIAAYFLVLDQGIKEIIVAVGISIIVNYISEFMKISREVQEKYTIEK